MVPQTSIKGPLTIAAISVNKPIRSNCCVSEPKVSKPNKISSSQCQMVWFCCFRSIVTFFWIEVFKNFLNQVIVSPYHAPLNLRDNKRVGLLIKSSAYSSIISGFSKNKIRLKSQLLGCQVRCKPFRKCAGIR